MSNEMSSRPDNLVAKSGIFAGMNALMAIASMVMILAFVIFTISDVEFAGEVILTDDISLGAVLNYTHGKAKLPGQATTPADRIPPLNGQVELDWYLNEQWLMNAYVRFAATQDRLSPRDVRDPRINPNGTPDWVTTNVNFTFTSTEFLTVVLAVENSFDQQYRIHGSGIDARGINFSASVNVRW